MEAASQFAVSYGRNLTHGLGAAIGPAIVVAHPEPWEHLRDIWGSEPIALVTPGDLSIAYLDGLVRDLPASPSVVASAAAARWIPRNGFIGGAASSCTKFRVFRRWMPASHV